MFILNTLWKFNEAFPIWNVLSTFIYCRRYERVRQIEKVFRCDKNKLLCILISLFSGTREWKKYVWMHLMEIEINYYVFRCVSGFPGTIYTSKVIFGRSWPIKKNHFSLSVQTTRLLFTRQIFSCSEWEDANGRSIRTKKSHVTRVLLNIIYSMKSSIDKRKLIFHSFIWCFLFCW